jgi:dTDP-4-amino-4,6-dideoxygalactose transaminase
MTYDIPFVDLQAQQAEVHEAVMADIDQVVRSGAFIGGEHVAAFEGEYAAHAGSSHCVGVANGTDALEIALRAGGVGSGGEVILPANTFVATAEAVVRAGATPVLVDVDPLHLLLDPDRLEAALTSRTRAVIAVHLFGQMAPMEKIREALNDRDILIVEDAAQSQGASRGGVRSGSWGTIAATSFYPGKNLGAGGDAGAITTDDEDLAARARLVANHGSERKYIHEVLGFNSRMDAVQAVLLRHKLRRLDVWNAMRQEAALRYSELLSDCEQVLLPQAMEGNEHVWHLYPIRIPERDEVLAALEKNGIGAGIHYPVPVHLTPAFHYLGHAPGSFPVSEAAAREMVSLPMFPHITPEQQSAVVEVVRLALGR